MDGFSLQIDSMEEGKEEIRVRGHLDGHNAAHS